MGITSSTIIITVTITVTVTVTITATITVIFEIIIMAASIAKALRAVIAVHVCISGVSIGGGFIGLVGVVVVFIGGVGVAAWRGGG